MSDDVAGLFGLLLGSGMLLLIVGGILALVFAGFWLTFEKAGQPGWASLIPFYNVYIYFKVAGLSGWFLLLLFVPFLGFLVHILAGFRVAQNFGRGPLYALGLVILPFVFFLHLGLSDARYAPRA